MAASCFFPIGISLFWSSLEETGHENIRESAPGDCPLDAPSVLLSKGSFSETLHLCPSARNVASHKPDTGLRWPGLLMDSRIHGGFFHEQSVASIIQDEPRCKEMDWDHHAYDQHQDGKESRWDPSLKEHPGGVPPGRFEKKTREAPKTWVLSRHFKRVWCDGKQTKFVRYDVSSYKRSNLCSVIVREPSRSGHMNTIFKHSFFSKLIPENSMFFFKLLRFL